MWGWNCYMAWIVLLVIPKRGKKISLQNVNSPITNYLWTLQLLRLCRFRSPNGDHDDVIKWNVFSRYWPFVPGIHRSPVKSQHKGQWRGTLMFSLICALNKQSCGWCFETPSCSFWRHCNVNGVLLHQTYSIISSHQYFDKHAKLACIQRDMLTFSLPFSKIHHHAP